MRAKRYIQKYGAVAAAKYVGNYLKDAIPMFIFFWIYVLGYKLLENSDRLHYSVIHTAVDDYIPFVEVFIIPYYLWFGYVIATTVYMYIKDRENYHSMCAFLCIGMGAFLVISALYPNIQYLRPDVMPRDNIFTHMVSAIYRSDTPTNIWPSIHVFNSVAVCVGIFKSRTGKLLQLQGVRIASIILSTSIVLSTMFVKQHSFSDVVGALVLCIPCYVLVYHFGFSFATASKRRRQKAMNIA